MLIVAGGHNTDVLGEFMSSMTSKSGDEDPGVRIDDGVWVGAKAVILRGAEIRRGAVVGAGAVVTKSVPPCAIVAEDPAVVVGFRFKVDHGGPVSRKLSEHERSSFLEHVRLGEGLLRAYREQFTMLPPRRVGRR